MRARRQADQALSPSATEPVPVSAHSGDGPSRKAFAVSPNALRRKASAKGNPLSAGWTLYDPRTLAEKLGLPVAEVDRALIETGFAKAVDVRMEVLRWKERLRLEDRELNLALASLDKKRIAIRRRLEIVREALEGTRNILRLPRDRDASLAEDAKRLSPEGVAARAEGIAPATTPSSPTPTTETDNGK